jgi:glycosyltransferase involved in cell wall biosynthesis
VDRCLRALKEQTIFSDLEMIVVDDGSTDKTSAVGRDHGATVVRHERNRGLAAARNSGLDVASAPVVAFLDDDCEPEPKWAEQLLSGYEEGVAGVGGSIMPKAPSGFMLGYLRRHNPLKPQEANLAKSDRLMYRLYLYGRRQWKGEEAFGRRDVYSFAGANMSFLRQALIDVGKFDERFQFGAEELDLCMRMIRSPVCGRLLFLPEARVTHHFEDSLRDTLRRSRAYGRGSARLYRKWPSVLPTVFPGPLIVLALLFLAVRLPVLDVAALVTPQLLYPQTLHDAVTNHTGASLVDPYVQLAQETFENVGFIQGLWLFRHLAAEPALEAIEVMHSRPRVEQVR